MAFDPLEERRRGQRGMLDLFGSSPLSGGGMLSAAGMPPVRPMGMLGPAIDQRSSPLGGVYDSSGFTPYLNLSPEATAVFDAKMALNTPNYYVLPKTYGSPYPDSELSAAERQSLATRKAWIENMQSQGLEVGWQPHTKGEGFNLLQSPMTAEDPTAYSTGSVPWMLPSVDFFAGESAPVPPSDAS